MGFPSASRCPQFPCPLLVVKVTFVGAPLLQLHDGMVVDVVLEVDVVVVVVVDVVVVLVMDVVVVLVVDVVVGVVVLVVVGAVVVDVVEEHG